LSDFREKTDFLWSQIIDVLNERFGTTLTEADELYFDQIEETLIRSAELREQARANPIENFRYGFEQKFEAAVIDRQSANEALFEKLMDDPEFSRAVTDLLLEKVYERLRGPESVRDRAELIARYLAAVPGVDGVCLFGSTARGDTDPGSDVDLIVVGTNPNLSPSKLLRTLPEHLRGERLSLIYYPHEELEELFRSGVSFIDHLRHEGEILYDKSGVLSRVLSDEFELNLNVDEEVQAELARLDVYSDLKMFKGNFLFVLTQLYAIGKSIVMLGLTAEGARQYNRDAAFRAFKKRHPDLALEVDTITELRPFYRLVTRRGEEPLPFPYKQAESEVERAIGAIRRIAGAVR
jgi:predicted nucleotidyltransferase